LVCFTSNAQEFNFKEYGANQGLPSSQVYDMHQSENGYIWFATDRGLATYNGYEFESFGLENGLPGNVILNIFPQENNEIWFATIDNKVFSYNQELHEFQIYPYNTTIQEQLNLTSKWIESIYLDSDHNVHLAFTAGEIINQLVISNEGTVLEVKEDSVNEQASNIYINYSVNSSDIPYVYYDNSPLNSTEGFSAKVSSYSVLKAVFLKTKNVCAFIVRNSVVIVNREGEIINKITKKNRPLNIVAIDESHIMIGYNYGGATIINSSGNIITTYLKDKSVTNILKDHQENYWFSTHNSGVFYLKDLNVLKFSTNENSSINSLIKNIDDELYVGYDNGNIIKIDIEKKSSLFFKQKNKYTRATLGYFTKKQQLYYSSSNSFYVKEKDNTLELDSPFIRKISEEQKEGVIFSHEFGISLYPETKKNVSIETSVGVRDACYWNGAKIIATDFGLYYLKNDSLEKVKKDDDLLNIRVDDIDVNTWNNKLYLGTIGKGLVIFDGEHKVNITKSDGLLSNIINEVYIQDEHTIWLATNGGVNKIIFNNDGTVYEIKSLNNTNGLITNEVKDIEIIKNTVWIGTTKGLVYVPTSFLDGDETTEEEHFLEIKEVSVNENTTKLTDLNTLSYKDNYIQFIVEGISFKEGENINYYYSLEGLNDLWYETKNRNIRFPSLPPGNYTFKVSTCSQKEKCTKHIVEKSFSIRPPFWKTWWFRTTLILMFGVVLYLFFKIRILSYNRNVTRELIRLIIKRFTKKEHYIYFREAGQDVKIKSKEIIYIKSSGNYVDVITLNDQYTIREKLGKFTSLTPDSLEYLRVHRMFIVRIDNIRSKSRHKIVMQNGEEIPVGRTYVSELDKIL
jgi:ligand-binding sensor domain-containing protein